MILAKKIMDEFSKGEIRVKLSVDYNPDGILAETFNESGIDSSKAPLKTTMFVNLDSVNVKYGYGAPWEEIFNSEKEDEISFKRGK